MTHLPPDQLLSLWDLVVLQHALCWCFVSTYESHCASAQPSITCEVGVCQLNAASVMPVKFTGAMLVGPAGPVFMLPSAGMFALLVKVGSLSQRQATTMGDLSLFWVTRIPISPCTLPACERVSQAKGRAIQQRCCSLYFVVVQDDTVQATWIPATWHPWRLLYGSRSDASRGLSGSQLETQPSQPE